MTRDELLMAISLIAHHDAEAAAAEGDGEESVRLCTVSDEAADMASDPDAAWDSMLLWLTGRDQPTTGGSCPPTIPSSWADLGL